MGRTKSTAKGTEKDKGISINEPSSERQTRSKTAVAGRGKGPSVAPPSSESSSEDDTQPLRFPRGIGGRQRVSEDDFATVPPTVGRETTGGQDAEQSRAEASYQAALRRRSFNAERYADARKLDADSPIVTTLKARKLTTWLTRGEGFKPSLVREFYSTARLIVDDSEVIRGVVAGREVRISIDDIASYLQCERPPAHAVAASHEQFKKMTVPECASIVSIDPSIVIDKFTTGNMHVLYSVMNKLLYANLRARGTDSDLPLDSIQLLLEFMGTGPMDIAHLIFLEMKAFISAPPRSNMPFPQMITVFITRAEIISAEPYARGEGPITRTTISRSLAARQRPPAPADVPPVDPAAVPPEDLPPAPADPPFDTAEQQAHSSPVHAQSSDVHQQFASMDPPTDSGEIWRQIWRGQQSMLALQQTMLETQRRQTAVLESHSAQLLALQRSQGTTRRSLRAFWRSQRGDRLSDTDLAYFADSPPTAVPDDLEQRDGDDGVDGADS